MSVFELLKKDHKKVDKLFKEIENTDVRQQKHELFKQINQELLVHTKFEEQHLYPLLKEIETSHDITFESIEEHHVIKFLLEELHNFSLESDIWDAKITVLQENIEHHVKEEEEDMFPKAKKVLDKKTINELTEKKEALEGKVKVSSTK